MLWRDNSTIVDGKMLLNVVYDLCVSTGELKYCKNGHRVGTLMHVDCALPLWAFFDIYGTTNRLESLGMIPFCIGINLCRILSSVVLLEHVF